MFVIYLSHCAEFKLYGCYTKNVLDHVFATQVIFEVFGKFNGLLMNIPEYPEYCINKYGSVSILQRPPIGHRAGAMQIRDFKLDIVARRHEGDHETGSKGDLLYWLNLQIGHEYMDLHGAPRMTATLMNRPAVIRCN